MTEILDESVYEGHCKACESGDWFKKGDEDDCRCPENCHIGAMEDLADMYRDSK